MSLSQVSEVTSGRQAGPPMGVGKLIHGIATDSRRDCSGKMFVALDGPRFDGHQYVGEACRNGAVAAMVEHEIAAAIPMVIVSNTLESLGQIATWWRAQFDIPVVGITGSVGKTTVKELLGSILSRQGPGVVTEGNLNNEIGVPLTLTRLNEDHQFAVVEMGMNHAGEISRLSRMSAPTVVIINNAAAAHLEGLGSVEAVAAAKGEIIEGLCPTGIVVLNADDDRYGFWRQLAGDQSVISFGIENSADVTARYLLLGDRVEMVVNPGKEEFLVRLPLPGRHNVSNALAAITAALALGIAKDDIRQGLESVQHLGGRLSIQDLDGVTLIDDTYNANPASMRAAIDVLVGCQGGRYIVVMGDMGELGSTAEAAHEEIGRYADTHKVDRLYACGPLGSMAVAAFGTAASHYDHRNELAADLNRDLRRGDVVLVKGSRSMHMEDVVTAITEFRRCEAAGHDTAGGGEDAA